MSSMDNKYNQLIDPLDKENEIIESFRDYGAKSFSKSDNGYDWLDDYAKCVVITNPYGGADLEIDVGDMGEFTIYFHTHHTHFDPYQGDYEDMINLIHEIINNNICAGAIMDREGKQFCSRFVNKEEVDQSPQTIFEFIFGVEEFRKKLTENGYTVEFVFWNPANNVTTSNP